MTEEEIKAIQATIRRLANEKPLILPDWALTISYGDLLSEGDPADDPWPSIYEPERDRHFDYLPLNLWDTTPD